ncbi:MAG TPA: hypothetical protein VK901_17285 [Nitrospiraceae bacterium]|nr:hypothetical protein [Nitrospiraceae bacterium]
MIILPKSVLFKAPGVDFTTFVQTQRALLLGRDIPAQAELQGMYDNCIWIRVRYRIAHGPALLHEQQSLEYMPNKINPQSGL